jgi:hypothetical protein
MANMEQPMTEIKYPDMRSELISYLEAICRFRWPSMIDHDSLEQALDIAIHFIYDDTALGENANSTVGWFLKSSDEAALSRTLVSSIDFFLEKHGINSTEFDRFRTKEWENLVQHAKALLEVLTSSEGL